MFQGFTLNIVASLLGILLINIWFYFRFAFTYWKRKGVEQINPKFPFGDIGDIVTNKLSVGDGLKDLHGKIKGKFAGIYCFVYPALIVKDADLIKTILLKDFNYFTDHGFYVNEKKEPISGQLFRLRGDRWKAMRKTVSPAFTIGKLKMLVPDMLKIGERMNEVLNSKAKTTQTIDILDVCLRFNADIIATTIFGIETDSFSDDHNEYILMAKDLFGNYSRWRMWKFILLVLAPQVLEIFQPRTVQEKQEKFIYNMVKNVAKFRENNNIRRNDIMQIMIDLKNNSGCDGVQLTDEDLAAQAYTYFFAGYESTSSTMNFLLYHCALDEDVQIQIQNEIDETLSKSDGTIDYEAISKMTYLGQVISETLRFYPILPHLNRVAVMDYTIPDTDIRIEKGTRIFISTSGIHHDANHYPEPEKFNPCRFSAAGGDQVDPFTYLPFGEGPRNCIGKKMGKMMVALGVVMILKSYSLKICEETPVPLEFSPFTYNYKTTKKIKLVITKRKDERIVE